MSAKHGHDAFAAHAHSLRERNKADKAIQIRQAARSLFYRKGYQSTTIRDIALQAQVGTGTVLTYCSDKRELLFQVLQEDLRATQEEAFRSIKPQWNLLQKVMHVFERMYSFYDHERALSCVFLKELMFLPRSNSTAADSSDLIFRLALLIQAAQRDGKTSAQAVATVCIAISNFMLVTMLTDPAVSVAAVLDALRELVAEQLARGANLP